MWESRLSGSERGQGQSIGEALVYSTANPLLSVTQAVGLGWYEAGLRPYPQTARLETSCFLWQLRGAKSLSTWDSPS
jgi:hypothetical protein